MNKKVDPSGPSVEKKSAAPIDEENPSTSGAQLLVKNVPIKDINAICEEPAAVILNDPAGEVVINAKTEREEEKPIGTLQAIPSVAQINRPTDQP